VFICWLGLKKISTYKNKKESVNKTKPNKLQTMMKKDPRKPNLNSHSMEVNSLKINNITDILLTIIWFYLSSNVQNKMMEVC
jgi:hypothetical protein